jgi:hypothetical protein
MAMQSLTGKTSSGLKEVTRGKSLFPAASSEADRACSSKVSAQMGSLKNSSCEPVRITLQLFHFRLAFLLVSPLSSIVMDISQRIPC